MSNLARASTFRPATPDPPCRHPGPRGAPSRPRLTTPTIGAGTPLALPPAFEAFCSLHHNCYFGYAHAHLPHHEAQHAVAATFGHLITHWPYVISRPNPGAYAWEQLVAHTGSRSCPLPLTAHSPLQYDVAVLHHGLGHPLTAVAAAIGIETAMLNHLVRTWQAPGLVY
ncbi:hypothetical protein AB0H82_10910 [Streptomyces sp. NPDC050732]|uniref:hypothetical protein n=1 Tax=Streptomyces sp. NPDC050732 TaxID=3154632 RepID=UPI003445D975